MDVKELKHRHNTAMQSLAKEMKEHNFKQVVIENNYGILKVEYEER